MLGAVGSLIAHITASAAAAFELAGKAGNIQGFVCESAQLLASCHFSLHIVEGLFVDDGFVGVLHIELRQLATVLFSLFGKRVFHIFFLQEQVAGVGYIGENHLQVRIHPAASVSGGDALAANSRSVSRRDLPSRKFWKMRRTMAASSGTMTSWSPSQR